MGGRQEGLRRKVPGAEQCGCPGWAVGEWPALDLSFPRQPPCFTLSGAGTPQVGGWKSLGNVLIPSPLTLVPQSPKGQRG